jgi:hypothetical protein
LSCNSGTNNAQRIYTRYPIPDIMIYRNRNRNHGTSGGTKGAGIAGHTPGLLACRARSPSPNHKQACGHPLGTAATRALRMAGASLGAAYTPSTKRHRLGFITCECKRKSLTRWNS